MVIGSLGTWCVAPVCVSLVVGRMIALSDEREGISRDEADTFSCCTLTLRTVLDHRDEQPRGSSRPPSEP